MPDQPMLEIITARALPCRHGFFTRRGGASSGIFAGLNCGPGSGDQAEIVAINRTRAAAALDLGPKALAGLHQIHSADVLRVDALPDPVSPRPKADAMVTATPGIALSVLTADCQPVLFADRAAGVIGAAHAGWRGALAGVLEATIDAMEALGARRAQMVAVIGPCISQRAYEVGDEFLEAFLAEDPAHARFFANGAGGRYLFDLPGFGLSRLRAAGIGHAEWTGHCTHSDPGRFFSYRRATQSGETDYGRLLSAIRL